jgi:hypothetical protein
MTDLVARLRGFTERLRLRLAIRLMDISPEHHSYGFNDGLEEARQAARFSLKLITYRLAALSGDAK